MHWFFVIIFSPQKNNTCAIFKVRPAKKADCRCGKCGRLSSVYDSGRKETRRLRGRDWNGTTIFLESELKRVKCRKCGVVTQQVPWARHKSGFTYDFEKENHLQIRDDLLQQKKNFNCKSGRLATNCLQRKISSCLYSCLNLGCF